MVLRMYLTPRKTIPAVESMHILNEVDRYFSFEAQVISTS